MFVSGSMLVFLLVLDFCFCFLVKIRFLIYLKLCKPSKKVEFVIIINLERII